MNIDDWNKDSRTRLKKQAGGIPGRIQKDMNLKVLPMRQERLRRRQNFWGQASWGLRSMTHYGPIRLWLRSINFRRAIRRAGIRA